MLTTTEAAGRLAALGITVKGQRGEVPPNARTIEHWCRKKLLNCQRYGVGRRAVWLVSESELDSFVPPTMGRPKPRQNDSQDEQTDT